MRDTNVVCLFAVGNNGREEKMAGNQKGGRGAETQQAAIDASWPCKYGVPW